MTITLVCQSCDDSFEVDYAHLAEGTKGLKCPGCGKKLSSAETEEFVTALDEVLAQVAALRKRFAISLEIDAEDLPAPYDTDLKRAARSAGGDDEDEEAEDDEEGGLEDELSEDEDEEQF